MHHEPNVMLADLYEKLIYSKGEEQVVAILQTFLSLILSSEVLLTDQTVSIAINPCLIEAYYWNNDSFWQDPYVRKDDAQNGGRGAFVHSYMRRLPRMGKTCFSDKRNGFDVSIGNKEGVYLSFLLKQSIVLEQKLTESELANFIATVFAPSDRSCSGVSVSLLLKDIKPEVFMARDLPNIAPDDNRGYRFMPIAVRRRVLSDLFKKELGK